MNCLISFFRALFAGVFFMAYICPASAADKAGQDQIRRFQQQLRATEREKAQLTEKKAEVEAQLKGAQNALSDAKRRGDATGRRNSALARDLATSNTEKEVLRAKLSETEQGLVSEQRKRADAERRLADALRQGEEQRRAFAAEKQQFETALNASRERNERMYKLGYDLIARCERSAVLQAEPFTGIQRARIEKMAEEDRDKFDRDRLPAVK